MTQHVDAAILGSGFGGLAAALALAESGARVALFERLNYPGGCASTFTRRGYKFESGATLFAGFGPGQLFSRWIKRHDMQVRFETKNPIVELRAPGLRLSMTDRRGDLLRQLLRLPGAPVRQLVSFFHEQEQLADILWSVMDDERMMPPFGLRELFTHIARSPRYAALLPWVGRPFGDFVRRHRLQDFAPLRIYLDALSQISLQLPAEGAEAAIAFGILDYFHRGTGHVHGGIGELAWAMVRAIETLGGQVHMADAVRGVDQTPSGWRVRSRRREVQADVVISNLLPGTLAGMLEPEVAAQTSRLDTLQERVQRGWGAAMIYLAIDADALPREEAHHIELIDDVDAPYTEGNHVFVSVSGADEVERAPKGQRTATISTHIKIGDLFTRSKTAQAERITQVQARMRRTIRRHLPALLGDAALEMTASPRTFERFTARTHGYVGGVPRTPGLHNYDGLFPRAVLPGLYHVGDSVFPGPSTLATALGGVKVAALATKRLQR